MSLDAANRLISLVASRSNIAYPVHTAIHFPSSSQQQSQNAPQMSTNSVQTSRHVQPIHEMQTINEIAVIPALEMPDSSEAESKDPEPSISILTDHHCDQTDANSITSYKPLLSYKPQMKPIMHII